MNFPSFFYSWIGRGPGSALVVAAGLALVPSTNTIYAQSSPAPAKPVATDSALSPATPAQLKTVKALDEKYQKAPSVEMGVNKLVKLGLLGGERKSAGRLTLSNGRLRMELEGDEKSLLVINKETFWAVTFPDPEFKDAPVQVITGSMGNEKASKSSQKKGQKTGHKTSQSQGMLTLLTQGGFLKFFNATGVQKSAEGNVVYFLEPKKQQTDFRRARLTVSADGNEIRELRYWDERDNETTMTFKSVVFGKKPGDSVFTYAPPANAEIMKM